MLAKPWFWLLALTSSFAALGPSYAASEAMKDPHVEVRLVRDTGGELAVTFDIEPGWHIYWHNPGDTGMATTATIHPLHTPARFPGPERFVAPETGFVTYGYSGRAALFFASDGSEDPKKLQAEARWLACKERCVLQTASATLSKLEPVDLGSIRARLPQEVQPEVFYRGDTAVVTIEGGPFELFPPIPLEDQLAGFRSTKTGLELDLKSENSSILRVVLQRKDGRFLTFNLPSPPATKE